MTQVPVLKNLTRVPSFEHPVLVGSRKRRTVSAEVAVAVGVYVSAPAIAGEGAVEVNEIDWLPSATS